MYHITRCEKRRDNEINVRIKLQSEIRNALDTLSKILDTSDGHMMNWKA